SNYKGKTHIANVAVDCDDESEYALASKSNNTSDNWIMNSAASWHMCPNKEEFTSLKYVNGGTVLMGNDSTCGNKGVG
ncbi:hypothetical protein, partial [Salmonella enterica]|uniref:hypothetical protein n=1 Tax=Salmonella enterica TaxID=28901 RepID=UPI00329912B1